MGYFYGHYQHSSEEGGNLFNAPEKSTKKTLLLNKFLRRLPGQSLLSFCSLLAILDPYILSL